MPQSHIPGTVHVLDVSKFSYAERLCAAVLQGLVNRENGSVFLDYGIYDDPAARRTNEVFMEDDLWYGKYREMLGNQDQRNLDYYQEHYGFEVKTSPDLFSLIMQFQHLVKGVVIWDEEFSDSANAAVMLCAQNNLLPLTPQLAETLHGFNFPQEFDLRHRWHDRVELYTWCMKNLINQCKPGNIACIEPGWQHPEFIDYVVSQNLFIYSLSASDRGLGTKLLLLLAFGPGWLRELLFTLRLDGVIRIFALAWMGLRSPEVRLSNRLQRSLESKSFSTIFGWHTCRDDELAFMLQLSANGLRLVPSHLASNFSFHSQLPSRGIKIPATEENVTLDPDGVYVTFTLSDGDQLMMMNTAELGNWYSGSRGKVAFNWEVQPLLAQIAPALLEKYISGATTKDCLIAGPAGAGYIIPPLSPRLNQYMTETTRICESVGITVINPYVADSPDRIIKSLVRNKGKLLGFLSGYAVVGRAPIKIINSTPYVANLLPRVEHLWLPAEELLKVVHDEILKDLPRPRFIGVHLFAYRTSIEDVYSFAKKIENDYVHIVRADDFLTLAREFLRRKPDGK